MAMKKMVKEALNERGERQPGVLKLIGPINDTAGKCAEIQKYCKQIISEYSENDMDEYFEGKVEVAKNILVILKNK